VPLIPGSQTTETELIGIVLVKLAAPLANSFLGNKDSAGKQQFFHIMKAQAETKDL